MYAFPSRYDATSADTGESVPVIRVDYVAPGKRSRLGFAVWLPNHAHRHAFATLRDLRDYCSDHGYRVAAR